LSLSSSLELVDWTARLCRTGKARIAREEAGWALQGPVP